MLNNVFLNADYIENIIFASFNFNLISFIMLKYSYKIYSDSGILYDGIVSFDELERIFKNYLFNLRYCARGFVITEISVADENTDPYLVFSDDELPF